MPMFIPWPAYPAAYAYSAPIDTRPLSRRNSALRQLAGSPSRPGSPSYVSIGGGDSDSPAVAVVDGIAATRPAIREVHASAANLRVIGSSFLLSRLLGALRGERTRAAQMETWTATTRSEANFGVDRRASDICRKIRRLAPSDVGRQSVQIPVNGRAASVGARCPESVSCTSAVHSPDGSASRIGAHRHGGSAWDW